MPPVIPEPTYELTPEQQYEFDLNGYMVLRNHYNADTVARLHEGIDELQAIPTDYDTYRKLGVASHHLATAMEDPNHDFWNGKQSAAGTKTAAVLRVDQAICGTDKFDCIVRDPMLEDIHTTLAGSTIFISATYFIEKVGPAAAGGLHNGGYPPDRHIFYAYDHANRRFSCSSTKSVAILSDMTKVENGPFAAIPGSHKANFSCPFDMTDPARNPLAVPVLAGPGDVIIFSEGMTHNAYAVTNKTVRRSVFFCYMPSINRDNLPSQRMSIYPDHVLERLGGRAHLLTSAGYI
jgi:ectoine hydroxylase-related dioxygenase (phytanoyl-CoA dioxygenase family)